MTVTAFDFEAHLRWCQNPANSGGFTCADDLYLVEGFIRHGAAATALVLGRSEAECRARWDALYPPELRSIRFQEVLLRTLRTAMIDGGAP